MHPASYSKKGLACFHNPIFQTVKTLEADMDIERWDESSLGAHVLLSERSLNQDAERHTRLCRHYEVEEHTSRSGQGGVEETRVQGTRGMQRAGHRAINVCEVGVGCGWQRNGHAQGG